MMLEKDDEKFLYELSKDRIIYVEDDKSLKADLSWFLLMIREHSEIIIDYIEFGLKWMFSWVLALVSWIIRFVIVFCIIFAAYISIGGHLNNLYMNNISALNGLSKLIKISIVLNVFVVLLYMGLYTTSIGESSKSRLKKVFNKILFRTVPYFVPSVITIWEYAGESSKPHLYQIDKNSVNKYIKENYDDIISLGISGKELTKYLLLKNKSDVLMYSVRPLTTMIPYDKTEKKRLSFVDNILFKLNILDIYRKFKNVEVNDVMYLEKVIRKIKNEKIVRKFIKKSVY